MTHGKILYFGKSKILTIKVKKNNMSVNVIVDYAECAEIVVDYANMMSA